MIVQNGLKYKNCIFLILSFIVAIFIFKIPFVHNFFLNLGSYGYLGAFVGGMLFVSTFTVATGGLILMILTETLSPVAIGIIGGLGAVIGDFIIFRFIKNNLSNELEEIYNKIDSNHHLVKIFHTKYFSWTLPVIGAIIIASPLPDEVGVSLMGISKMNICKFLLISFILNSIGIFLIISTGLLIRS